MFLKNLSQWRIVIVGCIVCLSCSRELPLAPPAGAKILIFEQNTHAKTRAIYQTNADGEFKGGETVHTWWGGIVTREVSHRLHATLMANVPDVYFVIAFPKSGRKSYCVAGKDKNIPGCAIPAEELKENEFLIEVFAPKGLAKETTITYRFFMGIEGQKEIKFYKEK